jgi:hypothetical protein
MPDRTVPTSKDRVVSKQQIGRLHSRYAALKAFPPMRVTPVAGAWVLDMFEIACYRAAMSDVSTHRPANPEDVTNTLAFALRYEGRRRVNHADEMMARITAERLVRHLSAAGFVVMKAPPAPAPTTSNTPTPVRD